MLSAPLWGLDSIWTMNPESPVHGLSERLPFHGLRRAHLRRYLDEFVFRWNRRRHTATAFDTLLGIGARLRPADYRDIVGQRV